VYAAIVEKSIIAVLLGNATLPAMKKIAIVLTTLLLGTSAAMACPMEGHGTQSAENKDKPKADKPADKTADKATDKTKADKPAEKPADKAPAAPAKKPA
jgi:hypothetical protein